MLKRLPLVGAGVAQVWRRSFLCLFVFFSGFLASIFQMFKLILAHRFLHRLCARRVLRRFLHTFLRRCFVRRFLVRSFFDTLVLQKAGVPESHEDAPKICRKIRASRWPCHGGHLFQLRLLVHTAHNTIATKPPKYSRRACERLSWHLLAQGHACVRSGIFQEQKLEGKELGP